MSVSVSASVTVTVTVCVSVNNALLHQRCLFSIITHIYTINIITLHLNSIPREDMLPWKLRARSDEPEPRELRRRSDEPEPRELRRRSDEPEPEELSSEPHEQRTGEHYGLTTPLA